MNFVGLLIFVVFGDELDFAILVAFASLGAAEDGEEAPVYLIDRFFNAGSQVGCPGIGVGGADEVVGESEKVGAVTGAH